MGERPVPVESEVERALASMRAGFLSGSSQIAAGVVSLEEHLAEAPLDERERVGAAVARIVGTQERLIAKIDRLPAPSWDRFKAMVSIVKAQQTVLDELGLLVKEHVLPRQLQDLSVTPVVGAAGAAARKSATWRLRSDDDGTPRSLLSRTRERTGPGFRGLAAMIVAALVLSLIPRDTKLQDVAAKLVEMVGAGGESAAPGVPNATDGAGLSLAQPPTATRSAERVPSLPDATVVTDRPGPAATAPLDQKRRAVPTPPPTDVAAVTGRLDPAATVQPGGKRVAAPAVVNEPATPPADVPNEQFVPVVFTHQDHAAVMRVLTNMQRQYPNLLLDRQGEVQPVDLGKKGIWHRLVFLPAGPRPEAAKLCDQLMAEGYDRCWVKGY